MTTAFDAFRDSYEGTVTSSISFSGLPHDFFLIAKADRLAELFAEHFGTETRPSVLDVGCGVGRLHRYLFPLTASLCASDISDAELDRAKTENPDVEYRLSDGNRLPWGDHSFDCALATCVVHHVAPAKWSEFAQEMRRVVVPGGLVVVIEHNPWNPLTRLAVIRCPFDHDAVLFGARRGRELLREAGCRNVNSRHFLLIPSRNRVAGKLETWLQNLPLGAQYLAVGVA